MEGVNLVTGVIIPYLNLALFLFLASKVLKGPLLNVINGRRVTYDQSLQEASAAKAAAEAKNSQLKTQFAELESFINDMNAKAAVQTQQEVAKIKADSVELAANLTAEAKRIAAAEVNLARESIRQEILDAVEQKVGAKLAERLGEGQQEEIFQRQLQLVSSAKGDL